MNMKVLKRIIATAIMAVAALSVVAFAACGGDDTHEHSLTHYAAVAATEDSDGNIEYWYCSGCGKYFSDANATTEISASSIKTTYTDSSSNNNNNNNNNNDNGNSGSTTDSITTADVVDESKTVSELAIYTNPDKMYYELEETFDPAGCTILVTYKDKTTDIIALTSSSFTYTVPAFDSSGTKTFTIQYGKKYSTELTVTVANKSYKITFHYNYDGSPEDLTVKFVEGQPVTDDSEAARDGYEFYGWYIDADFRAQYEFGGAASADQDLYALWIATGAATVEVTFDYNYYGDAIVEYSYPVESGSTVSKPADPARTGYSFVKWVDDDGNDFDFDTSITQATTITATWNKTVTGTNAYVFEAEDTDLTGKVGPALSGTATGIAMIVKKENANCSNDRCVSYLFQSGMSLEFYIASDEAVTDAKLEISVSQEYFDSGYTYDSSSLQISVNSVPLSYTAFTLTAPDQTGAVNDFQYVTISTSVSLNAGANLIKIYVNNNESISGTTIKAAAPDVDAIKITTSAVLIWDANYGLPMTSNY